MHRSHRCIGMVHLGTLFIGDKGGVPMHSYANRSQPRAIEPRSHLHSKPQIFGSCFAQHWSQLASQFAQPTGAPPPPPAAPFSRTVVHCTPCAHSRAHEPAGGIEQAEGPRDGRTLGSSVPAVLFGPAKQAGWNVESYPIPLQSA